VRGILEDLTYFQANKNNNREMLVLKRTQIKPGYLKVLFSLCIVVCLFQA
jgi:hypothetical protein